MSSFGVRMATACCAAALTVAVAKAQGTGRAAQPQGRADSLCRVAGRITSANLPLPGVSVLVRVDGAVLTALEAEKPALAAKGVELVPASALIL